MPNLMLASKGETPLFDKVDRYIHLAEDWITKSLTSMSTFTTICNYSDVMEIKDITARLSVVETFRLAIPQLDIVLTTNGFAVVSTQNLTPASKPRIDRLLGSLAAERDQLISRLLVELVGASKWLSSDQAAYFGGSIFFGIDICDSMNVPLGQRWEKFKELRPKAIDIEDGLADDYFSPELMTALRNRVLRRKLNPADTRLVAAIRAQVVVYLQGGTINSRRMVDMVQYIRERPDDFPEWHDSDTARQFTPPVFRNAKKASGYFF